MYSIRNYRFALTLIAVTLSGTAAQAQAEKSCFDGGVLRIRVGPGVDHPIAGTIPARDVGSVRFGQCVMADDGRSSKKWCPVSYRGMQGWASECALR
jgi:uncharacterized protein YraI